MLQRIFAALYVAVLSALPAVAYAAGVTLSKTVGNIDPWDWGVVAVLSMVAGLAALLQRLKAEASKYEDAIAIAQVDETAMPDIPRWSYFIWFHMVTAILTGVCAFFACEAFDVDDFKEALCIAVCAWGGAKILDKAADGFADGINGAIKGLFSIATPSKEQK
jgi:hypothetical protein